MTEHDDVRHALERLRVTRECAQLRGLRMPAALCTGDPERFARRGVRMKVDELEDWLAAESIALEFMRRKRRPPLWRAWSPRYAASRWPRLPAQRGRRAWST